MKRKIIYTAVVILTIINIVALGAWVYNRFSSNEPQSIDELRAKQFEQLKHELSLSSKQITKAHMHRSDFLKQMDALSVQLAAKRTELAKEIWQTNPDSTRINNLVESIGQIQSAAQRKVIAHLLDIKSLLTPKQQQKFYSIVLKRFTRGSDQPMPNPQLH